MNNYNYITDDDIEKTRKYKEALDQLQSSVNGLNGQLPNFADGMKAGLKAIGEKLPDVVQSMIDLNKQNRELAASGGQPVSVLKQLASSMFSWNGLVSVGVTLLATYGDALIDWVSDLFKGEIRVTALAKAMKEQKIVADALVQARLTGAQSAQGELTALTTLYRASQNMKLSYEERQSVMKALRDQWPSTFKNMDDEAFKTGKTADAYKQLRARILDAAYAEAYKNQITKNAARSIEDDARISKEREANIKLLAEVKEAKKQYADFIDKYRDNSSASGGITLYDNIERAKQKVAESDNKIYNFLTDKSILNKQNNKFLDEIDKLTQKEGNGVSILTRNTPNPQPPAKNGNNPSITNNKTYEIAEESANIFAEFNKRVKETNTYYDKLKASKKRSSAEYQLLEKQHQEALAEIKGDFQKNDLEKLAGFEHKLQQIIIDSTDDVKEKAKLQAEEDKKQKLQDFDNETAAIKQQIIDEQNQLAALKGKATDDDIKLLKQSIEKQQAILNQAADARIKYEQQLNKDIEKAKQGPDADKKPAENTTQPVDTSAPANSTETNKPAEPSIKQQLEKLRQDHDLQMKQERLTKEKLYEIEETYAKKKADLEDKLATSRIHAGDKYIDAVLKNSKKDSAIYKAAFMAKKATSIADTIISTKRAVMDSLKAYSSIPFIGQALGIAQAAFMAAQGAMSIADIAKQKPGFAAGGQYISDGRGALLPGYSRTDNTNAYLRSGEAVVVSEAMRNPWARNLVSAINVAHGGRDFSVPNTTRGYAIGGIFTDGGNANRYYNQPVNDIKDIANTLAYQMINNFPPIYVDVKDVNNQQSILAQTINRVNL